MARRNSGDDDPRSRKNKRVNDIAQEQEQESAEKEAPKPEHARLQDQFGNAMLAGMLGSDAGMGLGGLDIEVEYAGKQGGTEQSGPELGGDDDPVDVQGPLLIDDIGVTANATIKKGEDKLAFTEPMPDDVLPPEDPDYIERVAALPSPELPASRTLDPLVQPSADAVRTGLLGWAHAASLWAPPTADWQLLLAGVRRGMPLLQDPYGRVAVARSRAAAIATCGMVCGPVLRDHPSAANAAAIDFHTELAARAHRVRTVAATSQRDDAGKLPSAGQLFTDHAPPGDGRVVSRDPSPAAAAAWLGALETLAGFTDPTELLPVLTLAPPPPEDDDDPLGLDAVLFAETGGRHDPEEGAHTAVMNAAERLATAAAQTRVRLAGVAVALAEASEDWSRGAPTASLNSRLRALDDEVLETLQTLVEVAQASQRRAVHLDGLGNGLRRCARKLRRARSRCLRDFMRIGAGVLPPESLVEAPGVSLPKPVAEAFDIGEPRRAAAWAAAVEDPAQRRLVRLLVELCDAIEPAAVVDPLELAVAEYADSQPHLARALSVVLGAVQLRLERPAEALATARALRADGLRWRNGTVLAEGAMLGMEAYLLQGDVLRADQLRTQTGAELWALGARGSLSLLARWEAPEPD